MITAKNLIKKYENNLAIDDVSFEIEDGCIYGIVGSNGSGKSTLLRLISGVLKPESGVIGIDGMPSFDNPVVKAQIVFVGDTPYFFNQTTIKEMASFYRLMYPTFSEERYKELLSIFGLDEKRKISSFSKGMKRQASLIVSLAARPRYLLMDEAFDGLDVVMRRTLASLLLKYVEEENMTVLIASHNLKELEDIASNIALIHNGKLIRNGSVDELCSNVHKIQVAFKSVPETTVFDKLDVIKIERTGSLLQIIARGEKDEIMSFIDSLSPVFSECIEPTLEEIFVYELEVYGYDVKTILE